MVITNNMSAINAERFYKLNVTGRVKNSEKLSSGYRINKAADDAAGLTISEKMREQIRGLNQGTENAKNGISWVQTGEGVLGEVHDIMHRMKELSIQSLNDTNTPEDRAALQSEFDALQSEIDRICGTAKFNDKSIFSEHEPDYHQIEGNRYWDSSNVHTIDSSMNTLTIQYREETGGPVSEVTITVPEGIYTTQELIDEIDDSLCDSGAADAGLMFEYTDEGTCNLNYEGGKKIEGISGGLSYLINDLYTGGSVGALIGTTIFRPEYSTLEIAAGKNDNISFQIQGFDGTLQTKNITIPEGDYNRQQLIDLLNKELADTSVQAVKYSTGIKLQSDDSVITGFKGNMFKIEREGEGVYSSIFYDNVMYGGATTSPASFQGGAVITSSARDAEHNHYEINDKNNILKLSVNGGKQVELKLKNGDYSTGEMSSELNDLFKANGIEATVQEYSSGSFMGLKITSTLKGVASNISIDKNSSAYNTLFVDRNYTIFNDNAILSNETKADSFPTMTGGKNLNSNTLPITINSNNDQFVLRLNGTNYTIKLGAKTYNTSADIRDELDKQLNGDAAPSGYKGKVDVSIDSLGRIVLKGKEGSGLTSIDVAVSGTDKGYNDLFVGKDISYKTTTVSNSGTSTKPAKITLNTDIPDPAKISSPDNKITVNVNGSNKEVSLPTGNNVTHKQIIDAINSQLEEKTTVTTNTFKKINAMGSEDTKIVTAGGNGTTKSTAKEYSNTGTSEKKQGQTGTFNDVPAKITIDVAVPKTTVITDKNNTMTFTMGNKPPVTKTITLNNGSYSQDALKKQLQSKIDEAFGKYEGGATVEISNNKLVLTSRLNKKDGGKADGSTTEIKCATGSSSFLKELHTTRTAAEATSSMNLASSIKIDSGNQKFSFQYTDEKGTRQISVDLAAGTYQPGTLVNEINKQLAAQKIPVTASVSSGKLKLASNEKGSEYGINYSTSNGGSSSSVLFGDLESASAASATAGCDMQPSIEITDSTNGFSMHVNGKPVNLTLDNGTYTRAKFVEMLNKKLNAAGAGVTAKLSGNRITYTTEQKGKNASIDMDYNSGGTSMLQIYGKTNSTQPGVKASFDNNNKLVLTGTQNGGSLSISSNNGGSFQKSEEVVTDIKQKSTDGYISTKHSNIDGTNVAEPIIIDKWNKELKFVYSEKGAPQTVNLTLDEKTYNTFDELKDALSKKLDNLVGAGKLTVSVTGSGVNIECKGTGSNYKLSGFSGGFYDKVLCSGREQNLTTSTKNLAGGQRVDSAFTIGRRDIRNSTVQIESNLNDEFTFDLTYEGKPHPITLKIKAGSYDGNKLVKEMQKKLNEELKKMGLSENLIEVGIGGVSTNVAGSNDSNALCLKLSKDATLPSEGEYIIDGVRGSAAFYVFYQSDGKMAPAYIQGSKDISGGAVITDKNNKMSFDVDGTECEITLDEGKYSSDGLINHINEKLDAAGISVAAKLEGKNLKLSHKQFGDHLIDRVTGTAKNTLFFQENIGDGKSNDIKIQLSGDAGDESKGRNMDNETYGRDYLSIERPIVNTAFLGINSIAISRPKYANKALGRLEKALGKVSDVRSMFGAMQNRLEHAIYSNQNTEENTTSAESLIRDADMAAEMVSYSKNSILQQASQAMIAQANSSVQGVTALLQ